MDGNLCTTTVFRPLVHLAAATLLVLSMSLSAGEGSAVMIGANSISAASTMTGAAMIELRVAGPGDFRAVVQGSNGAVDWYRGGLVDGEYRYEVFVTVGEAPAEDENDSRQDYRKNGRFMVEDGIIHTIKDETPIFPTSSYEQTRKKVFSWAYKFASLVIDFLVPPVAATDVFITNADPLIYWDDTSTYGDDWYTRGWSGSYSVYDVGSDNTPLYISAYTPFALSQYGTSLQITNDNAGGSAIYLSSSSGLDVLRADSVGDIELADGAVFIDKSTNSMGIGTVTPASPLHILNITPSILLDDALDGDVLVRNDGGEVAFIRSNDTATEGNGQILTLEDSFGNDLYPGLGIWETNPEVPLHVGSHDGMSGRLLVENVFLPTAEGDVTMFELRNIGTKIVRFQVSAGGGNAIWSFDNEPTYNGGAGVNSGRFRIAKVGTGVPEFSVDGFGHGRFYGNSYAVNHVNTSSRKAKTDFETLNESEVLAKLMGLEVSAWRYKQEDETTRHIGPVAEDFQAVFGLGDGKHISTVDTDGVALAAIKAIKVEKDAEINALRVEKDALVDQIENLTNRLKALEELMIGQFQVSVR